MKRLHVNLTVADLDESVEFYTRLFGDAPSVIKADYAKWLLEDPRINFSISNHGEDYGIDHLGLQAEDDAEFAELRDRLQQAERPVFDQADVVCCYARSTKAWIRDPSGVAWETFISRAHSTVYGDGSVTRAAGVASGEDSIGRCCA